MLSGLLLTILASCTSPAEGGAKPVAASNGAASSPVPSPASTTASPAGAPTAAAAPARTISEELALATFDTAWTRIEMTDFDPDHGGVDWAAVRDEYRPQAAAALSTEELRRVLWQMVGRLGRSHFAVIPGEVADRKLPEPAADGTGERASSDTATATASGSDSGAGAVPGDGADSEADDDGQPSTFGLELRLVEDRATVVRVEPGSAAADAGVERGWAIRTIDGRDPTEPLAELSKLAGNMGRYAAQEFVRDLDSGSRRTRTIVFVDATGAEHEITMKRRPSKMKLVKIGTLPALPLAFESGWVDDATLARAGAAGARIGLIRFSIWLPEVSLLIDRAVDELRDADGIIMDLRGNPGGFGGMAIGVGGHFVAEPVSIGTMTTRDSMMHFNLNPRRSTPDGRLVEPIAAPFAILTDPLTASTSEVFAGGMKDIGRARVFGESSAGAALPAQMHRLPNGDVLLHAIADFRVPSGAQMEGAGVIPDEPRTLSRESIARDGDPVLLDAVKWIRAAGPQVP